MARWLGILLALLLAAPAAPSAAGSGDLEGLWTTASLTPLERPPGFAGLLASDAEAAGYEAAHNGSPIGGQDGVGQVASEWWDMGGRLARIDGHARSSLIVEPPDGQLPYTQAGKEALARARSAVLSNFDGPEARPAPERCLMGVGGTSLPPMLNGGYNNNLQIVQTPDHVVIVTEMNHDARIVSLGQAASVAGSPSWIGNSVGRWEGSSLIVVTTGFHPALGWRTPSALFLSPRAKVTERFTRVSPEEIRYAFEVEDPEVFTRPWRGEMPLRRTVGPMYEVACHEGNYSLSSVLSGARQAEAAAVAGSPAR